MLDRDLAKLYEVETKILNQSVKRNIARFPDDFMFHLTTDEWGGIQSQINLRQNLRSQIVTSSEHGGLRYLPYVFTEQGIAMLSGVLHSEKAIQMNISIMRAFVEIRRSLFHESDLKMQLFEIKQRIGDHDAQLNQIYDALENLLDEKAAERKWAERERIGFKY